VALSLVLALGSSVPIVAAEPEPAKPSSDPAATAPAAKPPAAIPVEELALQATEVAHLLRTVATDPGPGGDIAEIRRSLPGLSASLALELKGTTAVLDNQPSLETLQAQDEVRQRKQLQLARLTTPAILVGAADALWL
jgi:hypothetical protein